jgi:hypothetical protein
MRRPERSMRCAGEGPLEAVHLAPSPHCRVACRGLRACAGCHGAAGASGCRGLCQGGAGAGALRGERCAAERGPAHHLAVAHASSARPAGGVARAARAARTSNGSPHTLHASARSHPQPLRRLPNPAASAPPPRRHTWTHLTPWVNGSWPADSVLSPCAVPLPWRLGAAPRRSRLPTCPRT